MDKPWLLDLFAGAGGAGEGYRRAGFHVVSCDIRPMPRNPHEFYQDDALRVLDTLLTRQTWHGYGLHDFQAIHASPPCQAHSLISRNLGYAGRHADLIPAVRARLASSGTPWVLENVPGAPLCNPAILCGTSFGLGILERGWQLQRHRLFESNIWLWSSPCRHRGMAVSVCGHGTPKYIRDRLGAAIRTADYRRLMGISWMARHELSQAIPPAYTMWVGRQLLAAIGYGEAVPA